MKIKINEITTEIKEITLTYLNAHESIFCDKLLDNFVFSIRTEFIFQSKYQIDSSTVLKILKKMNPLLKIRRIWGIENEENVVDTQYVIEFNSKEDSYILLEQLQCLVDFEKDIE